MASVAGRKGELKEAYKTHCDFCEKRKAKHFSDQISTSLLLNQILAFPHFGPEEKSYLAFSAWLEHRVPTESELPELTPAGRCSASPNPKISRNCGLPLAAAH